MHESQRKVDIRVIPRCLYVSTIGKHHHKILIQEACFQVNLLQARSQGFQKLGGFHEIWTLSKILIFLYVVFCEKRMTK